MSAIPQTKSRWAVPHGFAFPFCAVLTMVAAAAASPPVTSGLRLLLCADGLIGLSDGDPVAVWPDLSGQGLDVMQSSTSRQPTYIAAAINGLPAVRFDGGDWLTRANVTGTSLTSVSQATAYIVLTQLGSDPRNSELFWGTDTNRIMIHATWDDYLWFQHGNPNPGGGGGAGWLQPPGWDDTWHLVEFVRNGPNWDCAVNGAGWGRLYGPDTPEIDQVHTLWVGADAFGNVHSGDIAEILLYDRALALAEREQMAAYFAAKYGLPIEPIVVADMNCSGVVGFDDINPFVLAITNVPAYYQSYPTCNWLNGDCDVDGDVDFDDINPFVAILSGGA